MHLNYLKVEENQDVADFCHFFTTLNTCHCVGMATIVGEITQSIHYDVTVMLNTCW